MLPGSECVLNKWYEFQVNFRMNDLRINKYLKFFLITFCLVSFSDISISCHRSQNFHVLSLDHILWETRESFRGIWSLAGAEIIWIRSRNACFMKT